MQSEITFIDVAIAPSKLVCNLPINTEKKKSTLLTCSWHLNAASGQSQAVETNEHIGVNCNERLSKV